MRQFEGYQHGINLGGWLSQRDSDTKEYMDSFLSEEDIGRIADMGLDHVRIPVDSVVIEKEDGTPAESGYEYLDRAVSWCRQYGLRIVIDLHKTHGYSFDPLDRDMDRENFFHDAAEQERFFSLWERIARRYASDTDIAAFELLNEVVSPNIAEEWNIIADRAVERIHAIAPKAWIVIGGVRYNHVTSVPMLHKPADGRVVFNFHCYEPFLFTHQNAYWVKNMPSGITIPYPETRGFYETRARDLGLSKNLAVSMNSEDWKRKGPAMFENLFQPAVQTAEKWNVPLYCSEYGVIDRAPEADTLRWITDITAAFDRFGIGRALWTYRNKDFGLISPHYDRIRDEIVKRM